MLWLCFSRPLELHFVRARHCCQQNAAALVDQYGDCKVLANLTPTSLNIPLGNENEAIDSSKTHHGDQKSNCCSELSHISLHSQWNEGHYHASEYCDCPHRLGCCVSVNVVRIKSIDV